MQHRRRGVFHVSDRALLRFLQRAGGLDVESVRAMIAGSLARAVAQADAIGVREYRIVADGLVYLVKNNLVVTVFADGAPIDAAGPQISLAQSPDHVSIQGGCVVRG